MDSVGTDKGAIEVDKEDTFHSGTMHTASLATQGRRPRSRDVTLEEVPVWPNRKSPRDLNATPLDDDGLGAALALSSEVAMSLLGWFKGGRKGFGGRTTAEEVVGGLDLTGKTILITGCTSGIGFESMKSLGGRGATILAAARSSEKAAEAARLAGVAAIPVACELADPQSVRAAIDTIGKHGPLDVLLLNAGIMALPRPEVVHGYERQFFTNHVGHFMLATGLLDQLSPTARVVVVSSAAHRFTVKGGVDFDNLDTKKGYSALRFYGQSKLANVLFVRELTRRFAGTGKRAYAVHPGVVMTNLARNMNPVFRGANKVLGPVFLKSPQQGAATQVWAAVHPDAEPHGGAFLADCHVASCSSAGRDDRLAAKLWTESERIVASFA